MAAVFCSFVFHISFVLLPGQMAYLSRAWQHGVPHPESLQSVQNKPRWFASLSVGNPVSQHEELTEQIKVRYQGLLPLRLKGKSLVLLSYCKRENGKNPWANVRKKVQFGKKSLQAPNDSHVQISGGPASKRQSPKVVSLSSPLVYPCGP